MFVVKNITNREISIPELRINLSPGNTIDLDMVSSRFYIEQARSLKYLFSSNSIVCVVKDSGSSSVQLNSPEQNYKTDEINNSSQDIINYIKQLDHKLSKRIDEKSSQAIPGVDPEALNKAIGVLMSLQNFIPYQNKKEEKSSEDQKSIDETKVINIQKRTIDRLSSNAQSKVRHEEQKTDKDVTKNAEELEGLL